MAKLSNTELKAVLASEKADSLSATQSSKLNSERTRALDYYMGDVSDDVPTVAGRSSAVSSDVADTIEGLMPSLMEIFAGSDDAVRFEPVGPEDVDAAEAESNRLEHELEAMAQLCAEAAIALRENACGELRADLIKRLEEA